jgi:lipid A ethanolaminephosphotransferase
VAIALTAVDIRLLHLPFLDYFRNNGAWPGTLVLAKRLAGVAGLCVAQASFVYAALRSPRLVRALALLLFAAIAFLQYGFVAAAGAPMNVQDVGMSLENSQFWPAMLAAFVTWRALVPVSLLGAALVAAGRPSAQWKRLWAAAALVTAAVHLAYGLSFYLQYDNETGEIGTVAPPMSSFQSFFRTLSLAGYDMVVAETSPFQRRDVAYHSSTHPRTHIVFVIDESISALHLSINGYARHTTPWLEELQRTGRITNWGLAAAASTYSNASVAALLTGFNDFPDEQRHLYTLPTIFQFAKAMNYRTHLLDGEVSKRRFTISWNDLDFVDDWRSAPAFGDDPDSDVRIAASVARLLREPEGQFIVILKRGDHVPPERNYPKGTGPWSPSRDEAVPPGQEVAAIVNSYDNAIRYNLDAFFRALLAPDGRLPRAVGLYTSDHAEELGDDGLEPFNRVVSREVTTVPLFMFGDERPVVDCGYRASHHNLFATLLDLMQVPASVRPWDYGRSLLRAEAYERDERRVLGGYMFDRSFFFEVRDFDDFRRIVASSASGPR